MSPDSLKTKHSVTDVCLLKIFTKIVHCSCMSFAPSSDSEHRDSPGMLRSDVQMLGRQRPPWSSRPTRGKGECETPTLHQECFTIEHREHISRFNCKNSSLHETEQQVRGLDCRRADATDAFCALASSHSNMKNTSARSSCCSDTCVDTCV